MAKSKVDELEEQLKGIAKWKADQEKEQAIQQGIRRGLHVRCMAVIGVVWSGVYWLGSRAVDNYDTLRAMIEAAIKAQAK